MARQAGSCSTLVEEAGFKRDTVMVTHWAIEDEEEVGRVGNMWGVTSDVPVCVLRIVWVAATIGVKVAATSGVGCNARS